MPRLRHNAPRSGHRHAEGGNAVEKYSLTLEELEAQSRVELLPDRIEMGRRRNRARVSCANQQFALIAGAQVGVNVCPVQQGNFG